MSAILVILLILVLLFAFGFGLFRFVFCNPPKKHLSPDGWPHPRDTPEEDAVRKPCIEALLGAEFEEVELRSFDGLLLKGRFYAGRADKPFVLMMHGYKANPVSDFCVMYPWFAKKGWNVLIPQQRACGHSEGSIITFGIRERFDCRDWINYLIARFGEEIKVVTFGVSLGSATVLMTGALDLPANVKGIMADCGYTTPEAIIKYKSGLPKKIADVFYVIVRAAARILGGFDPNSASPLEAVKKLKIPVIIYHGEEDDFVPYSMGLELYKACASEKYFFNVPGAGHASSSSIDKAGYEKATEEFLNKVI